MSGVKGRSGRRLLYATSAKLELPVLEDTEDSVAKYMRAIADAVAHNQMDPRTADTLIKAGSTTLNAIKQRNARLEVQELKRLLEEAKAVVRAGVAREVADRQHAE